MNIERHALLAAAAALALGAAGCATSYEHGPTYAGGATTTTQTPQGNRGAYMATIDDQVTRDIEQALRAASGLDASGIRVASIGGHVTLDGVVRSDADRQRAIEIARNTDVEHVVDVTDNLRTG